MKKLVSGIMFTLLMLGALTLTLNVQPAKSSPATITVPDDYATIQAAINAANPGDAIYVRNGIYPEHIEVNKAVTLTGESNQNTIIEAHVLNGFQVGVDVIASDVIIENFRIVPPNTTDWLEIPTLVFIDGQAAPRTNCTVRNCVLVFATDVQAGIDAIDIYNSANNTVTGNLITIADKTDAGIALIQGSTGNLIDNNTLTGGWVSIAISFAYNNILSNNYMTDQISWVNPGPPDFPFQKSGAVFLIVTSGDIIKGNTFVNNEVAISLNQADNCLIYNNNFVNNTQQALVGRAVTRIAWDNGYPCSGNFWSDYNGTDSFSGAYQNRTGSDGIGDTSYVVDASNVDHYPLMKPWAAHLLGDVNGDGTVDLKDLILLACAYGSTPGCTNWDANADLDGNGRVSLTDLVTLVTHYGQHNP